MYEELRKKYLALADKYADLLMSQIAQENQKESMETEDFFLISDGIRCMHRAVVLLRRIDRLCAEADTGGR